MNKQIVEDFIHAINEHDVDKIYSLMEDRFKFVDTYGNEEIGKDHMKKSWVEYFKWFSDYKIEITDTFANDNVFVILGFASGSYKNKKADSNENYWRLPAAPCCMESHSM